MNQQQGTPTVKTDLIIDSLKQVQLLFQQLHPRVDLEDWDAVGFRERLSGLTKALLLYNHGDVGENADALWLQIGRVSIALRILEATYNKKPAKA